MVKAVGVFNPVSKQIGDTVTVYGDKKIQFRDTGLYIYSSADGQLDIVADTLLNIVGDLAVSGSFTFGDAAVDNLIIAGDLRINDDRFLHFGTGEDVSIEYDEDGDNNLKITGAAWEFGVDDTGIDVKLYGATAGAYCLWDESVDSLLLVGGALLNVQGTLTVGVDDTGYDVQFFGATASAHLLWDESADSLLLVGGAKLNVQGEVTIGVDDTGYDVKFFGATAGAYLLWDESADELVFATGASIDITADKVMIDFQDGDASSIDPSATAETGWINVAVGGTTRYVPYYAVS